MATKRSHSKKPAAPPAPARRTAPPNTQKAGARQTAKQPVPPGVNERTALTKDATVDSIKKQQIARMHLNAERAGAPVGSKVRVIPIRDGYYDLQRRRAALGESFLVRAEDFSAKWMRRTDKAPVKPASPNRAIQQQHDETLTMKTGGGRPQADPNAVDEEDAGVAETGPADD